MRVGVCDFPSHYAFPPYGYGGIERWLWAVGVGARRAGAEVFLLGPAWRDDVPVDYRRVPIRLESVSPDGAAYRQLRQLGLDLLVVGHEYPSHPGWRAVWELLDCDVVTFQHDPDFEHHKDAFHHPRARLYCYSPEMVSRYQAHRPRQAVSVQFGLGEEDPPAARQGQDLVWLGRIDRDKAPHLAVRAAGALGRQIHLVGPVLDATYAAQHRDTLTASHVTMVGELAGAAKLSALHQARVLVYSCDRDYVEAGAAVFGESLRSGTPVAALAWRPGTCVDSALCLRTGAIATVHDHATVDDPEATAVERLAEAILHAEQLKAQDVQAVGMSRFDAGQHFRLLSAP